MEHFSLKFYWKFKFSFEKIEFQNVCEMSAICSCLNLYLHKTPNTLLSQVNYMRSVLRWIRLYSRAMRSDGSILEKIDHVIMELH